VHPCSIPRAAVPLSETLASPFAAVATIFNAGTFAVKVLKWIIMKLELDLPDSTLSSLRQQPDELSLCLRLMAAAKLYEIGHLSQERAAELSGRSRQDFLIALSKVGVSPFQCVEEDLSTFSKLP
jgi:predicted HTH domain antitoxin